MSPDTHPDFDAHEQVKFFADEGCGLMGVIALHSTRLGPAMGGCRAASYVSEAAALADVLRLSRGMSYKNAMADLPAGGGKAVLYRLPADREARGRAFEAFGRVVDALGGAYVTAEDVGTTVDDMQHIGRTSAFVAGLPQRDGRAGGDPSPWTALGVFEAMKAAAGRPMAGARIAVQGLGAVGYRLCARLHEAGARLVVADVVEDRALRAQADFGAEIVPLDEIFRASADVFSPNALGGSLNVDTIADLQAPVVCGGANNQLATPADGRRLSARGVVYAPDYVVNAGGIINVVAEFLGEREGVVEDRVMSIGPRVRALLQQAAEDSVTPENLADALARSRIGRSSDRSAA